MTRRPPKPPKPKDLPKPAKLSVPTADNLRVLGIVISPDRTIAILHDTKTKKIVKAAQGTNISGWEVRTIRKDGVKLGFRNREMMLRLHRRDDEKAARPKRKKNPDGVERGGLTDARVDR